jgi:hypothetical protein
MDMKSSYSTIRFRFLKYLGNQSYVGTILLYSIQVFNEQNKQYVHIWDGQDSSKMLKNALKAATNVKGVKIHVRNTDT